MGHGISEKRIKVIDVAERKISQLKTMFYINTSTVKSLESGWIFWIFFIY